MTGFNGILGYAPGDSIREVQESLGITQFPSGTSWYQIIGGLQIQGGLTDSIPSATTVAIPFPAPYETQLLGVFLQAVDQADSAWQVVSAGTDLNQFSVRHTGTARKFYWIALGV